MQRAGAAAAAEIALRYRPLLVRGVCVLTGPGNNGGDGWVVARALAQTGTPVRVIEVAAAKSADAIAERTLALPDVTVAALPNEQHVGSEAILVDAVLGTGAAGTPRGVIAEAVSAINLARKRGAVVVAIDLPTGVDATTGDAMVAVNADLTITFGTIKRGHLVAREACGRIAVVDIGLSKADAPGGNPVLVDSRWVAVRIPPIPADAHKGTRKKLAIIGGAPGMTGASILAARAALRSGIGMVRVVVAPDSLAVVQGAEPLALAGVWPNSEAEVDAQICSWADGIVIGPGLGNTSATRQLVDRVLARFGGPVVLDADALNVFDGDLDSLRAGVGNRQALLTPHAAEFARLMGSTVAQVLTNRFEAGAELARRTGSTVLLKGVPTTVTPPVGEALVSASGTPVLAAAGSGDLLSGIAGTLLTQLDDAPVAGAAAAWIHGHAGELAARNPIAPRPNSRFTRSMAVPSSVFAGDLGRSRVRGVTLEDVLAGLALGWPARDEPPPRYPVLLELPAVGEGT